MLKTGLLLMFVFLQPYVWADEPILPVTMIPNLDAEQIELGKALFHETKLSVDNTVSCASCHSLETGGVDGLRRSLGVEGREGDINTPTVLNSALSFRQFWNGRAASLEEQINGPLTNPKEMGNTWQQAIATLKQDPAYVAAFGEIFDDGITAVNIRQSLAEFERSLTLSNARFDAYLKGDENAINPQEKQGYQLFKSYGCVACHQGVAVGGNMYQQFGIMNDYFADRGTAITQADLGRYTVTGDVDDQHVFKVPSLRQVAQTAPYFHDGSAETLAEAIQVMGYYQLGRTLPAADVALIESFLRSLAGSYTETSP
ncbi:MAG: cytochrome-c peroxidase [Mariprofundaceae bacterium]|nr:cytochrome-c peroxidase [Mariprofundaceae bacterium]